MPELLRDLVNIVMVSVKRVTRNNACNVSNAPEKISAAVVIKSQMKDLMKFTVKTW